jgi:rubrerythrin
MVARGSKTYENLMRAFAGESQVRNRYNISAGLAKRKAFM